MKKTKSNIVRIVFQGIVLLYVLFLVIKSVFYSGNIDFEKYCPFGGLQALGSYLNRGSLACTMSSTQITMGLLLVVAMVLFGKLFCSYICPLGSLGEWFHKLGHKLKITIQVGKLLDAFLKSLKYILLFVVFYYTLDSSELFCKKFDPFFALTTGFGHDVVLWMALLAIGLWVFGSVVIRMFFCKYLCPLGALTNIFRYFLVFASIMLVYIILLYLNVELSYVWPLAISCVAGYILELKIKTRNIFPLFLKINRNVESCIDCNLCSRACHQGIDVANLTTVNQADCNLCNDCLHVCPVENTLTLSGKRRKWLTPSLVVLFVTAGVIIGATYELPTITEVWGSKEEMNEASVLRMEGLKDIKCFGSSISFANKMRRMDGVMGVSTFVNSHTVKIWYDDEVLTEDEIKEGIFKSSKYVLQKMSARIDSVQVIKIGLDKFFDVYDNNYLIYMLRNKLNVNGMMTEYGCPVNLYLYYADTVKVDPEQIKEVLETDALMIEGSNGNQTVDPGFEVVFMDLDHAKLSLLEFAELFFNKIKYIYNDRQIAEEGLYCYVLNGDFNGASFRDYQYLYSHLGHNTSIYGFENFQDSLKTKICVYYDQISLPEAGVYDALSIDSLTVHFTNGKDAQYVNPFDFKEGGKSVKVDRLSYKN